MTIYATIGGIAGLLVMLRAIAADDASGMPQLTPDDRCIGITVLMLLGAAAGILVWAVGQ
jgi:hypothetical protein